MRTADAWLSKALAQLFRSNERRASLVHTCRVAMLCCILLVMHLQHDRLLTADRTRSLSNVELNRVSELYPQAAAWGESERHGGRHVLAGNGESLGYVIQTAPDSDRFLGFSGPTNLLIAFDTRDRIVGILLLTSRDTRDHVELILQNPQFFQSWVGQSWIEAAARKDIDGVAGATLTSLAMVQGIQKRLGASEISTKFPKPLELVDVKRFFPLAIRIEKDSSNPSLWHVYDAALRDCGMVLRTSPAADEIIGYQGPTESHIAFAPDGTIVGIAIAASFDNEPYVGYVRGDAGFEKILKKYTLNQWSQLDIKQAGIEGVSGATMTSMAVAQGLAAAAAEYESMQSAEKSTRRAHLASLWRNLSTVLIVVFGLILGLTGLRGNKGIRVTFQIVVIVYLGLINGDLLSMGMFAGWAQSGVPWQNAIGLVVLAVAAITLPIVARSNVYCSHLCPHGAVQQLLPRGWKQKKPMPRNVSRLLLWIRPALIVWVVLVSILQLPFSLVDIEPFDAYAWRSAAWPTICVAVIGIIASLRVPMAYCRFGCGTGAIFQYLRRHSRSDRLTRADGFALVCLGLGLILYLVF